MRFLRGNKLRSHSPYIQQLTFIPVPNPLPHLLRHRILGKAEAEQYSLSHIVRSDGSLAACKV
jgi:hypothetical protein